jgi:hypothetical protein
MTFSVGDLVTWDSQSAGYLKKKSGIVVAVVPPRQRVNDCIPCGFVLKSVPGMPRQHESYLIRIGRSTRLYWPRVALLNKAVDLGRAIMLTDAEREAVRECADIARLQLWSAREGGDEETIARWMQRLDRITGLLARATKDVGGMFG